MSVPEPVKTSPFVFALRMFSSLKNPSYRLYFFGTLANFGAMSMNMVTNPLLIYRLTNSPALLGTMSLVGAIPMLAISAFGGAFADRLQKKKILIAGFICSAIVTFIIGLSLATGRLSQEKPDSWTILLVASFFQGIIMGLMMPALQAIIPEIVSREQLMNAIAMNMMGMNALNLVAPIAAGFMIDSFDFESVYYTMTGLYLVGAIIIWFMPASGKIISGASNIFSDIQKGFQYIRKDFLVLSILAFTLGVVVLSMPYQQLMPIFTDNILKVGARGLGTLMGMAGAGALVGSILLAALPNKKRGLILLGGGAITGAGLVVFSFSPYMGLSLVVIFLVGLGQAFRQTIGSALVQAYTQDVYMGRVMALMNMQMGIMSVCTFFAGLLAEIVKVQWVLGSLAIMLTVLSLVYLIFASGIRKIE